MLKLESLIPVAAPAPVGVVMGVRLYHEIITAIGADVSPIWEYVAGFFAVVGCVAVIGAEMNAYKYAGKALAEKEPGAAGVSILIGLALSVAIGFAIWSSADSRPLVVALLAAIGAYAVDGVRNYVIRKGEKKAESQATQADGMAYSLRMKELETKQALANARTAKAQASANTAHAVRDVRSNYEQREQDARALSPDKIAEIRAAWQVPGSTVRSVAASCGVGSTSAAKYNPAKGGAQ
jgi:hypothetical protein